MKPVTIVMWVFLCSLVQHLEIFRVKESSNVKNACECITALEQSVDLRLPFVCVLHSW